jgi:hypothetical protein
LLFFFFRHGRTLHPGWLQTPNPPEQDWIIGIHHHAYLDFNS